MRNEYFKNCIKSNIEYFKSENEYNNQELKEGIAINPNLSVEFFNTAHNKRDIKEMKAWWDKPFIISYKTSNEEENYGVYILDGGAWDRPTLKLTTIDFNEALKYAINHKIDK